MRRTFAYLFTLLLTLIFGSFLAYADCGVESSALRYCPRAQRCWFYAEGREFCSGREYRKLIVECKDGVKRMFWQPTPCRYRSIPTDGEMEAFCENRCEPPILDCSELPSLDSLINAICAKVNECRPSISIEDCVRDIESVSASDELGLAEGIPEVISFAVIRNAIAEGTIRVDSEIYCDCIHRIRNVSCSAFGRGSFRGLEDIEEIIPGQCGNDGYPGVFLPAGFNPVTGVVEH